MTDAPTCRICLEEGGGPMISPCACTGTQRYVHVECLQRWRMTTDSHARRTICPVCRHAYDKSTLPAKPRQRASRGLFGARLALTVDGNGMPLLRLIHTGAPVVGLAAGTLLVSTEAIGGGIFHQSVLLITQYSRETGTTGYILNVPVGEQGRAELRHALNVDGAPGAVMHGVGGPVALAEWQVLHGFDGIEGATEVGQGQGCFVGGELPQIQAAAREAWAREAAARRARGGPPRPPPVLVQVVYGHAAWAPGQLEGEMRHGAWRWAEGFGPRFVRNPDHETAHRRAIAIATTVWQQQGGDAGHGTPRGGPGIGGRLPHPA